MGELAPMPWRSITGRDPLHRRARRQLRRLDRTIAGDPVRRTVLIVAVLLVLTAFALVLA
jgi:hypothetical protein